ncbi:Hypothetical predicted protein [Podarcis lilfordi]|uniref:Uncharacterized protein n=1 Tax=Podarcis lilfordi TaxID=74358 RepID=A0AA35PLI6_9SAUR|nr:Hypothetical predicted protein [Podarcis lilfordi]
MVLKNAIPGPKPLNQERWIKNTVPMTQFLQKCCFLAFVPGKQKVASNRENVVVIKDKLYMLYIIPFFLKGSEHIRGCLCLSNFSNTHCPRGAEQLTDGNTEMFCPLETVQEVKCKRLVGGVALYSH